MERVAGYPHITKDPSVRQGQACVDDSGIAVVDLVRIKRRGLTEREILERHSSFTNPAQVYAAFLYDYDHQEEVDVFLLAEEQAEAQAASTRRRALYFARRREGRARLKGRVGVNR